MLLDHPAITQRYFYPRSAPLSDPFTVACDGAELACYHVEPHPGAKTFVHFHGNGEVVADYLPDYVDAIAELGVNVLMAEYRGYGGSTGEPGLARMLGDVEPIVTALGKPASELIVYGRSIGSIYAIECAHRYPDIAGLIIESGIADVLERLLLRVTPRELGATRDDLAAAVKARCSHHRKLAGYRGPLLVIHARDDNLIDVTHAESNHAWAASERKRLVIFEHGGHNAIMPINWLEYLAALKQFIASLD